MSKVETTHEQKLCATSKVLCGVDIIELATFRRTLEVGGEEFLRGIYTDEELAYCNGKVKRLAGRFAAKEAISKALGTGIRGIDWREMEVIHEETGCPRVQLHGQASDLADELAISSWSISLSYCRTMATAFVVATCA